MFLSIARHQHWCPAPTTPLAPGAELTVITARQGLAQAIAWVEADLPPDRQADPLQQP
jgi:hypothetical protein